MRLFEFESLELLKREGIRVPNSALISSRARVEILESLIPGIVKVQVLSSRRMQAGGVHFVDNMKEARKAVVNFLGQSFKGEMVERVLLQERLQFAREYFAGITYDSRAKRPLLLFSHQGGAAIDALAASVPEKIHRLPLPAGDTFRPYHATQWLASLGLGNRSLKTLAEILTKLVQLFLRYDAVLLEVNPLVKLEDGDFVALDCHMELDDEAWVRSPLSSILDLNGRTEGTRKLTDFERKARKIDELDHRGVAGRVIEFPGDLALLIGGGGASLTIFDALRDNGGKPANYCEIGGNPTVRKVEELTKLLITRPGVEKLAVIMNVVSNTRADLIARGVIKGLYRAGKDPREVLVVFRIPGSGEEECRKLLDHYGVPFAGRELSLDHAASIAARKASAERTTLPRKKHERVG